MSTAEKKSVKDLVTELQVATQRALGRVGEDGNQILGWRGFHIDLDEAEELIDAIRLRARGM